MIPIVTGTQSRELDRQAIEDYRTPSLDLMEAAGRGAYEFLESVFPPLKKAKALIVCGKGNNGGDGFVLARYLKQEWIELQVVCVAPIKELSPDAQKMARRFKKEGGKIILLKEATQLNPLLAKADLIIDGLLGTGLSKRARSPYREIITQINEANKPTLALDIPSGLCADTGQILGVAIQADWTATMGFSKLGLILPPGCDHAGQVEVIDIGLPEPVKKGLKTAYRLIDAETARQAFLKRPSESHKGDFGHLLTVAGSPNKLGAGLMSCKSALRTGAGLVTLALPQKAYQKIPENFLEIMYEPLPSTATGSFATQAFSSLKKILEDKMVIACGPGIGTARSTRSFVKKLVQQSPHPLVIDADGLNCLVDQVEVLREAKIGIVITPHPGEMARLAQITTREVQKDRLGIANAFARNYGVTVVLKGYRTIIATPEGKIYLNPTGNPAMATAGMGDVLTGMIASLLAQKIEWLQAITSAVYLHGLAGDRLAERMGDRGLMAGDIIDFIPFLIKDFLTYRRSNIAREA